MKLRVPTRPSSRTMPRNTARRSAGTGSRASRSLQCPRGSAARTIVGSARRLCACTCSPGRMSCIARPMAVACLITALPAAMSHRATLCPRGTRCTQAGPCSSETWPGSRSLRATATLSSGHIFTAPGPICCESKGMTPPVRRPRKRSQARRWPRHRYGCPASPGRRIVVRADTRTMLCEPAGGLFGPLPGHCRVITHCHHRTTVSLAPARACSTCMSGTHASAAAAGACASIEWKRAITQ